MHRAMLRACYKQCLSMCLAMPYQNQNQNQKYHQYTYWSFAALAGGDGCGLINHCLMGIVLIHVLNPDRGFESISLKSGGDLHCCRARALVEISLQVIFHKTKRVLSGSEHANGGADRACLVDSRVCMMSVLRWCPLTGNVICGVVAVRTALTQTRDMENHCCLVTSTK